jgi:peptidoglycan/LPS O-acetylase OafA/YrhL
LQPLWKFLTFTQNISINMFRNTFSHAWSLCVEDHFYLLLPILLHFIVSIKFTSLPVILFGFPIVLLAYGFMVIAAMSPNCILSKYKFRLTAILATLAYSIYLSHKIINHVANTQLKYVLELESYQVFSVCLFASVLGGLTLHLIVEKPFLILRDSLK